MACRSSSSSSRGLSQSSDLCSEPRSEFPRRKCRVWRESVKYDTISGLHGREVAWENDCVSDIYRRDCIKAVMSVADCTASFYHVQQQQQQLYGGKCLSSCSSGSYL